MAEFDPATQASADWQLWSFANQLGTWIYQENLQKVQVHVQVWRFVPGDELHDRKSQWNFADQSAVCRLADDANLARSFLSSRSSFGTSLRIDWGLLVDCKFGAAYLWKSAQPRRIAGLLRGEIKWYLRQLWLDYLFRLGPTANWQCPQSQS